MAITPEGLAAGHRYQASPFGCAVWCYAHAVPTYPCPLDDEE